MEQISMHAKRELDFVVEAIASAETKNKATVYGKPLDIWKDWRVKLQGNVQAHDVALPGTPPPSEPPVPSSSVPSPPAPPPTPIDPNHRAPKAPSSEKRKAAEGKHGKDERSDLEPKSTKKTRVKKTNTKEK